MALDDIQLCVDEVLATSAVYLQMKQVLLILTWD